MLLIITGTNDSTIFGTEDKIEISQYDFEVIASQPGFSNDMILATDRFWAKKKKKMVANICCQHVSISPFNTKLLSFYFTIKAEEFFFEIFNILLLQPRRPLDNDPLPSMLMTAYIIILQYD